MTTTIQQLYNPLFQYIKGRINNAEDAEDLTQDVFYKLSKSENSKIKNVKHWLYTIANNTIIDYYRKKEILKEDVDIETIEINVSKDEALQKLSNCIVPFINKLPEDYSDILFLAEIKDIPQKDIAKQLNVNYSTVRSKVQRGRKKLRTLLSECCMVLQDNRGSILDYDTNNCNSNC